MKLSKIAEQISLDPQRQTLFQLLVNAKGIPMSTSFKLGKVHKKFAEEVEEYHKVRNEKIIELGEDVYFKDVSYDAKGKEIKDPKKNKDKIVTTEQVEVTDEKEREGITPTSRVKKENIEKFFEESKEIEAKDINVNLPEIKAEDLGEPIIEIPNPNKEGDMIRIEITPVQLSTLDWLLS